MTINPTNTIAIMHAGLNTAQLYDLMVVTPITKEVDVALRSAVETALIGQQASVSTIQASAVEADVDGTIATMKGSDVVILANVVPTDANVAPFTKLLFTPYDQRPKIIWQIGQIAKTTLPASSAWNRIFNRCVVVPLEA